jgi:hypothetical protein
MDKNEIKEKETNKISTIDIYIIFIVILQFYLLIYLTVPSFTTYLTTYLYSKFLISHITAILNGLNVFLTFINLVNLGMIIREDKAHDRKEKLIASYNITIFIVFIYLAIQLLTARL